MKKGSVGGDVNGVGMGVDGIILPALRRQKAGGQYLKASLGYLGVKKGWGRVRMGEYIL